MKVELGSRVFTVSDDAAVKAEALRLTPERVSDLFRRSTRITHERGNRRTRQYLFMVQGSHILDLLEIDEATGKVVGEVERAVNCKTCRDSKKIPVFNECEACLGEGCDRCDGGLVLSSVPCPDCLFSRPRRAS
jgi:DnaJ-class molecular chaperone